MLTFFVLKYVRVLDVHDCTSVTLKVPAKERPKFNYYHHNSYMEEEMCLWSLSLRNSQSINQKSGESLSSQLRTYTLSSLSFFLRSSQLLFFFLPNPITFFCVLPGPLPTVATRNCATQHSWNFQRGDNDKVARKNAGGQKLVKGEDDDAIKDNGN